MVNDTPTGAERRLLQPGRAGRRRHRLARGTGGRFALDPLLFSDYEQIKRFFYLFFFRDPLAAAEQVVAADDLAFIDRLWRDWSPGFDAAGHLAGVKESLRQPANLAAATGYYRAYGIAAAGGQSADPRVGDGRSAPLAVTAGAVAPAKSKPPAAAGSHSPAAVPQCNGTASAGEPPHAGARGPFPVDRGRHPDPD